MTTEKIIIRDETSTDIPVISQVTKAAFANLEISRHTEQFIIEALRDAGALSVSLVAVLDGRVIGHIALSPVSVSDGTQDWYGLGPVSVLPNFQRKGVGTLLMQEGLSRLRALHARGCCLVGHPEYYIRFGFQNTPKLVLEGIPPAYFFVLSFDGDIPRGAVTFQEAFKADGNVAR